MSNYPEMENKENIITTKPTDNNEKITKTYNNLKEQSSKIINNALTNKVNNLRKQLNQVPQIYKNLRNNLTNTNNKAKKVMEENIANTGNHTASGYAMSKRMNNQNEYNRELTNIDTSEQAHINDINEQIENAYSDAATETAKMHSDYDYKMLQDVLNEQKRIDNFNYNLEKDNIKLGIDADKNRRENEKHELDMKYQPEIYQAELDGMYKENKLTDAKITKTNAETAKINSQRTSGGSGSKEVTSKMSAKDIASSIKEQISYITYDHNGEKVYVYDDLKAYMYLATWQKKFGLSTQVVNDAAIYLGIQNFL